jgi:hypothetical protein
MTYSSIVNNKHIDNNKNIDNNKYVDNAKGIDNDKELIRNVDSGRHRLSHLHPKVRRIVSNTICDLLEDVMDREVQDLGLFSG